MTNDTESNGQGTGTTLEHLVDRVTKVSVPLHQSIVRFDEVKASYQLSGEPGMALFRRSDADAIAHVSSSPSPDFMPLFEKVLAAHKIKAGLPDAADNSHMAPLVLLCVYLTDEDTVHRLGIGMDKRKPVAIEALGEEEARHDPELAVGDSALRAWTPLIAGHMPDAGVHPAVLEMRFHMSRSSRYMPPPG